MKHIEETIQRGWAVRILYIAQSHHLCIDTAARLAQEHCLVGVVESAPPPAPSRMGLSQIARRIYGRIRGPRGLEAFAQSQGIAFMCYFSGQEQQLAEFMATLGIDIICVNSMQHLLPRSVFSLPPYGALNLHPAGLPKYRGPNPLFWQFYNQEEQIGVTVHFIDEGEDSGDLVKQAFIPVSPGQDPGAMVQEVVNIGTDLMLQALEEIEAGNVKVLVQRDMTCPFRARRIKPGEALICWQEWPIQRVWHVLKTTQPWADHIYRPVWLPGFKWRIQDYETVACRRPPGSLGLDCRGFYASHREGKIRLKPAFSWRSCLARLKTAGKHS